jgi:cytochrome P450
MCRRLNIMFQTASALRVWSMAMSLYPDIQKRAQDEVDSVTGRERLPTLEDRLNLPFVDAVCKEVLRWRPVTPVGAFARSLLAQFKGT